MPITNWLTNCPEAAKELRKIDRAFDRGRKLAAALPLIIKVVQLRTLRAERATALDDFAQRWTLKVPDIVDVGPESHVRIEVD